MSAPNYTNYTVLCQLRITLDTKDNHCLFYTVHDGEGAVNQTGGTASTKRLPPSPR